MKNRYNLRKRMKVVVYTNFQMRDGTRPMFGPYWEGVITGINEKAGQFTILKPGGHEPCVFHESWVFPARLRDKVKIVGQKNPRLVVMA